MPSVHLWLTLRMGSSMPRSTLPRLEPAPESNSGLPLMGHRFSESCYNKYLGIQLNNWEDDGNYDTFQNLLSLLSSRAFKMVHKIKIFSFIFFFEIILITRQWHKTWGIFECSSFSGGGGGW